MCRGFNPQALYLQGYHVWALCLCLYLVPQVMVDAAFQHFQTVGCPQLFLFTAHMGTLRAGQDCMHILLVSAQFISMETEGKPV